MTPLRWSDHRDLGIIGSVIAWFPSHADDEEQPPYRDEDSAKTAQIVAQAGAERDSQRDHNDPDVDVGAVAVHAFPHCSRCASLTVAIRSEK